MSQIKQDVARLHKERGDQYPLAIATMQLLTPEEADAHFEPEFCDPGYFTGKNSDSFDGYKGLTDVLVWKAPVDDGTWSQTFYILRFADHWKANIGGMMEELPGELVYLFDEVAGIHGMYEDGNTLTNHPWEGQF